MNHIPTSRAELRSDTWPWHNRLKKGLDALALSNSETGVFAKINPAGIAPGGVSFTRFD